MTTPPLPPTDDDINAHVLYDMCLAITIANHHGDRDGITPQEFLARLTKTIDDNRTDRPQLDDLVDMLAHNLGQRVAEVLATAGDR